MRLCHPPDGSTSPQYKLLCFITATKICKEKNALAFNQDRCCHLVLCFCFRLIPFHCLNTKISSLRHLVVKGVICVCQTGKVEIENKNGELAYLTVNNW